MPFSIRSATVEDARAIALVRTRTWQSAYRGLIPDAFLDQMDPEANAQVWRERLSVWSEKHTTFVAEVVEDQGAHEGSRVVGFCSCGPEREADPFYPGEIYALYVLPEFQGQGAGKRLVWNAACWLENCSFTHLLIYVLRDNMPARHFYEVIGGTPVREVNRDVAGHSMVEVGYGYNTARLCERANPAQV